MKRKISKKHVFRLENYFVILSNKFIQLNLIIIYGN